MAGAALPAPLQDAPLPLGRLTMVELRKAVDTRASAWMVAIVAFIAVALTVILVLAIDEGERTFTDLFQVLQFPISGLVPVIGILAVTSEWSQRTALTTFTLVPNRPRAILAKALAVTLLSFAAIALVAALSAAGTFAWGSDGSWEFDMATLGEVVVLQVVGVLSGFAFGLAFQASAPAIVAYFLLPTVVSILGSVDKAVGDALRWVDINDASFALGEGATSATEWARLGTSAAAWLLVPLLVGLWRLQRGELK